MNQVEQVAHTTPAKAIYSLRRQVATQDKRIVALEQQVAAIAGMVNQAARETEKRIIALEAAIRNAGEAIVSLGAGGIEIVTRLERLETAVRDLHELEAAPDNEQAVDVLIDHVAMLIERVTKLEAALREVAPWLA